MPDGRGWRFALEVAFLVALAVVLGAADIRPSVVIGVMLAGWVLVALLEWVAWREEPHWGSGSPPRYYVPPASLPPRHPIEQGGAGYPVQREPESPTWIATPEMRAAALGDWPAAQPPVRDSGPGEGVRGNREVPPSELSEVRGNREVPPSELSETTAEPEPGLLAPEAPPPGVRPVPAAEPELEELAAIVDDAPLEEALLHEAAAAVGLEDAPVAPELEARGADPWELQSFPAAPLPAGARPSLHRIDPLAEPEVRRWPWQRAQENGTGPVAEFPALPRHARLAPERKEAD